MGDLGLNRKAILDQHQLFAHIPDAATILTYLNLLWACIFRLRENGY